MAGKEGANEEEMNIFSGRLFLPIGLLGSTSIQLDVMGFGRA
jgi:hypothetical protein